MSTVPYKQILGAPTVIRERLTIATQNTIPALSKTPSSGSLVKLFINGIQYDNFGASAAFSVSAKTVTWSAANAGFTLDTTDKVTVEYQTNE